MPTIFCDNDGCMFSDGCGFCDCDKLSIVGGVCEGSMHGGRNASDGDIDERLKAENAKLRELCRDLFGRLMDKDEHCGECRSQCEHDAWNFGDPKCVYAKRMRELGVLYAKE